MANLYVEFSNPGQVGVYQRRSDTLYGYWPPKRGRRASDGAPVGPDTPTDNDHYGYTMHQYGVIEHPIDRNRCAHRMVDPDLSPGLGNLSEAEKQWMRNQNVRADALTPDWFVEP